MLTLRPTKRLAKRLDLALPETPPPVVNRVADWCAHEFTESRRRYLLFCNTASLFPIVTRGNGIADDHDLITRLVDGMKAVFIGAEFEFIFQRWIEPELVSVQWAPVPDRAILGSMNELIHMTRFALVERNYGPWEFSQWLARTPMGVLGMNSPDRVFRSLRQ